MLKSLLLTSRSKIKEQAIKKGLDDRLHCDYKLTMCAVDCENPKQPLNSSYKCANNRIDKCLSTILGNNNDLIISVENIINVDISRHLCEDVCTVVICDTTTSRRYEASSFAIPIDIEYFFEARENSKVDDNPLGIECTVGEIINKHFPHVPADNWMSWATNGEIDREMQILDAFNKCFDLYSREQIGKQLMYFKDFPKNGVLYQSLNGIINDGILYNYLIDLIVNTVRSIPGFAKLTKIVGLDSRGYLYGCPLALKLKKGFVRVCKAGKEPGTKYTAEYDTEYSTSTVELMAGLICTDDNVLIVDDLVATGGTLRAAADLIEKSGGHVIGCLSVVNVNSLFEIACKKVGLPIYVVL